MKEHNFFETYHINPLAFDRCGLKWEMLQKISDNYNTKKPQLESVAKSLVENLLSFPQIHSINYRIKKDEHLIEKIIRKTIDSPSRKIDVSNYLSEITDLIGIRILHLFKEDWIHINNYITNNWDFKEQPVAYVRNGDSKRIIDYYKDNNCRIEEHPYGYRSIHYTVKKVISGNEYLVEFQVRTIFEEAWGEIDHVIRYPYHTKNELLYRLSSILNRIAGSADELGTYIRYLKSHTEKSDKLHIQEITDKNTIIEDLKQKISTLSITKDDKLKISRSLDRLEKETNQKPVIQEDFLWLDTFMQTPLFKDISSRMEEIARSKQFASLDVRKDLEIMKNAQMELFEMMHEPKKLKELLSDEYVTKLLEQIGKNKK